MAIGKSVFYVRNAAMHPGSFGQLLTTDVVEKAALILSRVGGLAFTRTWGRMPRLRQKLMATVA